MPSWKVARAPVRIPVPGGKVIEELFGRVSTGTEHLSLAHMIAPPHWGEPAQIPEFGELTIMVRGRMHIDVGDEVVVIAKGEAFWVDGGLEVRYSNPFDEESEYFAVCLPAFAPELAHRDGDEGAA